tara:strand:- start:187 stop:411 length:225 start_codon:yes stop_codon:yes gene_type:complete
MGNMTTRQVEGQTMEIREGDKVRLSDGRTANVLSVITAPGWDNMLLVDEGHLTREGFSMGTSWQHVHADDVKLV